jgi:tetratricopeptide (TPR) repeat protein
MRFLKGVIQTEAGKPADAINHLHQAHRRLPRAARALQQPGRAVCGQSQFDKARAALEMAIRTNPSYATAHENLGDVYAKLASQAYSKALQLDSNNTGVQPKLALIRDLFAPGAKGQRPRAPPTHQRPPASPAVWPRPPRRHRPRPCRLQRPPPRSTPCAAPSASRSAPRRRRSRRPSWAKAWAPRTWGLPGRLRQGIRPTGNQDRKAWEEDRRARIVGKSRIRSKPQRPGGVGQWQPRHGQVPPGLQRRQPEHFQPQDA